MTDIHIHIKTTTPESFTFNGQKLGIVTGLYALYLQDISFSRGGSAYTGVNLVGDVGDRSSVICEGVPNNTLFEFNMQTVTEVAYYETHNLIELGRFKNISKLWEFELQVASTNVAVTTHANNVFSLHLILKKI